MSHVTISKLCRVIKESFGEILSINTNGVWLRNTSSVVFNLVNDRSICQHNNYDNQTPQDIVLLIMQRHLDSKVIICKVSLRQYVAVYFVIRYCCTRPRICPHTQHTEQIISIIPL